MPLKNESFSSNECLLWTTGIAMAKYSRAIEDAVAVYAELARERFTLRFTDRDAFEERLRAGLQFSGLAKNVDDKINLTKSLGLFSYELFQAMICGGESYKPLFTSIMWDRLVDAGIIMNSVPIIPGSGAPFVDHQIDDAALLEHLQDGTFVNLFASPSRLPATYSHAVVAVDVLKEDQAFRGTGFVVREDGQQFLVTCRHNVDPADSITVKEITSASGASVATDNFALSPSYDIAVARLLSDVAGPCFVLSDKVEIFDDVYTLGYPLVPRAESLLLGHRGEMNGRAHLYVEKCPALIISNLVSPGSSGGPVLIRDGHCVGMTINWLEGERQGEEQLEKMRFSAALPAELLREAIRAVR